MFLCPNTPIHIRAVERDGDAQDLTAVHGGLGRDPPEGEIFCFRGRRGDLVKLLWHDGVGMSLYIKRLEAGKFIWPAGSTGVAVAILVAQLGCLLEGIDCAIRAGRNALQRRDDCQKPPVFIGIYEPAW